MSGKNVLFPVMATLLAALAIAGTAVLFFVVGSEKIFGVRLLADGHDVLIYFILVAGSSKVAAFIAKFLPNIHCSPTLFCGFPLLRQFDYLGILRVLHYLDRVGLLYLSISGVRDRYGHHDARPFGLVGACADLFCIISLRPLPGCRHSDVTVCNPTERLHRRCALARRRRSIKGLRAVSLARLLRIHGLPAWLHRRD